MSAIDMKTCNLCKKEHDKLLKPNDKVLGTQLSSVIRTILRDQQLKFPQKFLICAECSMAIIQTEILFKRLAGALSTNKTESESAGLKKPTAKNEKIEKIPEQKQDEGNENCDISILDENDTTALDNTTGEWTFNCAHCDFTTKESKLYKSHLSSVHNLDSPRIYQCMYCKESYQRINGIQNHMAYVHDKKPRMQRQRRKTITLDAPPLMSSTKIGEQLKSDVTLVNKAKVNKMDDDKKLLEAQTSDVTLINAAKVKKSKNYNKLGEELKSDVKTTKRKNSTDKKFGDKLKTDVTPVNTTKVNKAGDNKNLADKLKTDATLVKTGKVKNNTDEKNLGEQLKTDVLLANSTKGNQPVEETKLAYDLICEHCQYKTIYAKVFKNHLKNKHQIEDARIYKCKQCAITYARQFALQNHIAYQHENKPRPKPQKRKAAPPEFELSTATTSDLLALVGEIKHEEGKNELKCEVCSYEAKNFKSLKQHIVIKHQIDNTNQNNSLLEEHDRNDDDDEEKVFQKPQLKSHKEVIMNEVKNDWIFRCSHCTFESTKRKTYKAHIKSAHDVNDENIYKCIYCAGQYKRYNLLQSHVTNKHSIDLTLVTDTLPTYIESSQEEYLNGSTDAKEKKRKMKKQVQQPTPTDKREIESPTKRPKIEDVAAKTKQKESCVVCGKKFSTIDKLRAHMDKNHGYDVIKHCDNCDAQFRSIEKYKEHLFSEKCLPSNSLACQFAGCAKCFNKPSKLKQHMLEKHPDLSS